MHVVFKAYTLRKMIFKDTTACHVITLDNDTSADLLQQNNIRFSLNKS